MYSYMQINKVCGIFTFLKIWGLPTDYMQKWFFLIKTADRLWISCIPQHDRITTIEHRYDW